MDDVPASQCIHCLNLLPASIGSTVMGVEQNRASVGRQLFWRRLVGTALIYALILQPLLLTILGAQSANASAVDDLSLSQLCQHATDGSPLSPADQHKHPADNHCVFCFAAAFHSAVAPRPVTIQPVRSATGKVGPSARPLRLSLLSRYSAARPRGPPLSA